MYGDEFKRLLPGAALHLIDAAGHMVQYEQPDAVLDILLALGCRA